MGTRKSYGLGAIRDSLLAGDGPTSMVGRIRAFQLACAFAVVGIAATVSYAAWQTIDYADRAQVARQQADATTELAVRANRFSEQIAELLLVGAPERPDFESARNQVIEQFRLIEAAMDQEIALLGDRPEARSERVEAERLQRMREVFREIDRSVERMLLLNQQGRRQEAIAVFRSEIENRLDADLERLIAEAIADERGEVAATDASARTLMRKLLITALTLVGLLLVLTVGSGFLLSRSIQTPIRALVEGTQAIEHGDLAHRIDYGKRDEFGVLAGRFNTMVETLQRQTRELRLARDSLEEQVQKRTRELELANTQLNDLDEQRLRFLADVSHELRTPLTVLRAEAEVTLRGSSKPEETYRAALGNIAAQAADMGELVEDLMFIARSEADAIRFEFRAVSLANIVDQAVQDASVLARARNIHVSIDLAHPEPVVRADPRRLKQALVTVLENAARYADPNTKIEVAIRANDAVHAEIRVRDHGVGIPADEIAHVFDRFFRGSNAPDRASGSGLGLSIARWIVEQHEGRIDLSSEAGSGTEARLLIPLAA